MIGAAGTLVPEEPGLNNLWDRFLLRLQVAPVREPDAFIRLIEDTRNVEADTVPAEDKITADELDEWTDARDAVAIPPEIAALIVDIRERIARHNSMESDSDTPHLLDVSDRRWKQAARLLRTSAFLNGRDRVDALDCVILRHCLWSREEDIAVVNTIVQEALRRYSTSGRFDPESLRVRLDETLDRLHDATTAVSEEDTPVPVEYRGEYYRIDDYVDEHIALIWIGDFQNLSEEDTRDTDVFFYGDNDDYAYSERLPVRRLSDTGVEIDGQAFELETRTVRRTVEHHIDPAATLQSEIRGELQALREDVVSILESIAGYRSHTDSEAAEHLFVHRSYADILAEGMSDAEGVFAILQTDIDAAISSLDQSGT